MIFTLILPQKDGWKVVNNTALIYVCMLFEMILIRASTSIDDCVSTRVFQLKVFIITGNNN